MKPDLLKEVWNETLAVSKSAANVSDPSQPLIMIQTWHQVNRKETDTHICVRVKSAAFFFQPLPV